MPRIDDIFLALSAQRRGGLLPFITGGFPSRDVTIAVLPELESAGASIVEIGFPFSDPIADGPVIASSMHQALEQGVTPRDIFEIVGKVRQSISIGLVAMVSQSMVHRVGIDRFCGEAAESGFDGLIVPDVDLGDAAEVSRAAASRGLCLAMLVAPTTTAGRLGRILEVCSGFVYLLSRIGITGEQTSFAADQLQAPLEQIRAGSELPVALGFGISTPEHVRQAVAMADAAIVGSALVRRMGQAIDPVAAAGQFVRELRGGLGGGRV